LIKTKILVKLVFGSVQTIFACLAIITAFLLKFDVSNVQSSMNIPNEELDFYVVIFLGLGFVFVVGGLFLVYDWWESR
jgi:ssDNA-specific exonuclease RecJ